MEMKKYMLGEIATFINGRAYSQNELFDSGKYKIVRVGNLSGGNNSWYFSDLELEDDKYCYQGDLLYAWACNFGPHFWDEGKTIYHYHIWKVIENPNLADKSYLYYLLKFMTASFTGFMHGSTMIHITKESMEQMPIFLPSLDIQQKIATVLSSLDDKIALNRRMNAKLEQMAKRLYDHWFVQFDFPNADGKPYKASGGKMVWNETLKREIPEGWKVKKLGELFTTNRGVSYSTKTITGDAGIPMINLASFSPDGSYKIDGIKLYTGDYTKEKLLKPFDLVMCNTQQTAIDFSKDIIGKALLVPNIFEGDITSSHHVNTLKVHDEKLKFYLYRLFNTDYFHAYISHFASGTNIMGLDFAGVESYTAIIPNEEILKKFAEFTLNIEKKKSEIIRENTKFISLRDRLLPLLMNGQVEVK